VSDRAWLQHELDAEVHLVVIQLQRLLNLLLGHQIDESSDDFRGCHKNLPSREQEYSRRERMTKDGEWLNVVETPQRQGSLGRHSEEHRTEKVLKPRFLAKVEEHRPARV
jgi:allantoicase